LGFDVEFSASRAARRGLRKRDLVELSKDVHLRKMRKEKRKKRKKKKETAPLSQPSLLL
jgi:hypothetical protein